MTTSCSAISGSPPASRTWRCLSPASAADTQIQDAAKEIAAANYPEIRLLLVERDTADYPQEDIKAPVGWSLCTPETAKNFSAAAYFFARDLQKALEDKKQHVPIGLIDSTWGGTPAEAWTSLDASVRTPR